MEKKSKYSLFPVPPSPAPREPLPPLPEGAAPSESRELPPHLQQSPTIPPQELLNPHPQQDRGQTVPQDPLTPPAEDIPVAWPPLNNSWSPREDTTSTLNEPVAPIPENSAKRKMHSPTSSTSSYSSSQSSLHKPTETSPPSPPLHQRNHRRTVYFHSGIGGAGNYHKAIRENDVLRPMASNRSNHPRFLSSLFGTLGGKKGRRHQRQYNTGVEPRSSPSSGETLPLGAAEVMRRKMLGLALEGKSKENCARS